MMSLNRYILKYGVLGLTLLTLVSAFSVASPNEINPLAIKIYRDHFYKYDTVSNMPWDCGGNSYDLYLQMQKSQTIDLSSAYIVHAFYGKPVWVNGVWNPAPPLPVPLKPRAGRPRWAFHAALMVDGLVFDQYYSKQPVVFQFTDYIREMWGSETKEALRFQVIPVSHYQDASQARYPVDEKEFPVMTYGDVVQMLTK